MKRIDAIRDKHCICKPAECDQAWLAARVASLEKALRCPDDDVAGVCGPVGCWCGEEWRSYCGGKVSAHEPYCAGIRAALAELDEPE